jgi:hypothetical protein
MFDPKGIKKAVAKFFCHRLALFEPRESKGIDTLNLMRSARSALIVMPFSSDMFDKSLACVETLKRKYPDLALTLILCEPFRSWAGRFFVRQVISLKIDDANFLGFPKKSVINRLREYDHDVAIDLNPAGSLFSSILCAVSGAEVRIGFSGEWSNHFINYEFAPKRDAQFAGSYDALLNYLN